MPKKNKVLHTQILKLRDSGLTNIEIASKIGVTKNQVACILRKHYDGNKNYIKRITKHKHLHKEALLAYVNNSFEDAAKKLNLTLSEMKSCLTYAYKDQNLKHIRKDTRRKDLWTEREIKQMLQMIGIRPRNVIAKVICRGNDRVIKEKLQHIGLKYPKYTNGLSLQRFREVFNCNPEFYLQTDAGPGKGKYSNTFFKIVPWVYINDAIKNNDLNAAEIIKQWVSVMAEFQEWIHDCNAYGNLLTFQVEADHLGDIRRVLD